MVADYIVPTEFRVRFDTLIEKSAFSFDSSGVY